MFILSSKYWSLSNVKVRFGSMLINLYKWPNICSPYISSHLIKCRRKLFDILQNNTQKENIPIWIYSNWSKGKWVENIDHFNQYSCAVDGFLINHTLREYIGFTKHYILFYLTRCVYTLYEYWMKNWGKKNINAKNGHCDSCQIYRRILSVDGIGTIQVN